MGAIGHPDLIAGEQGRGDVGGKGEVPKGPGTGKGIGHDPGGLRIKRIGLTGLQVLLRLVVGVGNPSIHKGDAHGQIAQARHFLGLKKVVYFQKHRFPTRGCGT
jgi:hypothetical protein